LAKIYIEEIQIS